METGGTFHLAAWRDRLRQTQRAATSSNGDDPNGGAKPSGRPADGDDAAADKTVSADGTASNPKETAGANNMMVCLSLPMTITWSSLITLLESVMGRRVTPQEQKLGTSCGPTGFAAFRLQ
eukprot:gene11991-biopygen3013